MSFTRGVRAPLSGVISLLTLRVPLLRTRELFNLDIDTVMNIRFLDPIGSLVFSVLVKSMLVREAFKPPLNIDEKPLRFGDLVRRVTHPPL